MQQKLNSNFFKETGKYNQKLQDRRLKLIENKKAEYARAKYMAWQLYEIHKENGETSMVRPIYPKFNQAFGWIFFILIMLEQIKSVTGNFQDEVRLDTKDVEFLKKCEIDIKNGEMYKIAKQYYETSYRARESFVHGISSKENEICSPLFGGMGSNRNTESKKAPDSKGEARLSCNTSKERLDPRLLIKHLPQNEQAKSQSK
jgi:hypothetical protein